MNRKQLIEKLAARQTDLSSNDVEIAIKHLIGQITDAIVSGEGVQITSRGWSIWRPIKL